MWGLCLGWNRRHMVGGNGDKNGEVMHTLCGEIGKPPIDYTQVKVEKCSKCFAVKKRKEAENANSSNS